MKYIMFIFEIESIENLKNNDKLLRNKMTINL